MTIFLGSTPPAPLSYILCPAYTSQKLQTFANCNIIFANKSTQGGQFAQINEERKKFTARGGYRNLLR